MTREDREFAKSRIEYLLKISKFDERDKEALEMAIQALSQELCTDAVSREAVIKCVESHEYTMKAVAELRTLPSVNPQPCDDAISREDAYEIVMMPDTPFGKHKGTLIRELPSVTQKSVIEDIKTEIKELPYQHLFGKVSNFSLLDVVLEIIDKHIKERTE